MATRPRACWVRHYDRFCATLGEGFAAWPISITDKDGHVVRRPRIPTAVLADDLPTAQRKLDNIVIGRLHGRPSGTWKFVEHPEHPL